MKKSIKTLILWLVALLVLAIAPLAIDEKGYVLIAFNNYTIEGTIVSFSIMLCFAAVATWLLVKLVRYVLSIYGITRFKWASKAEHKRLRRTQDAFWQYINGDYKGVLNTLKQGQVQDDWENLSSALAASAAVKSNDKATARGYLTKIEEMEQDKAALLYVACDQPEMAELVLKPIANNKKATALELRTYCQFLLEQQDWAALLELLPRLEKLKALSDAEWQSLFCQFFAALDKSALVKQYDNLSKSLRQIAEVVYLQQLAQFGEQELLDKALLKVAKSQRFDDLYTVLSNAQQVNLTLLKKWVQGELKKTPHDTSLLLSLAYIAKASDDNELACKVFSSALDEHNTPQHWQIAAQSYAQQGLHKEALALYQQFS